MPITANLIASENCERISLLIDAGAQGNFLMPVVAICHSYFVPRLQSSLLSAIMISHVIKLLNLIGLLYW